MSRRLIVLLAAWIASCNAMAGVDDLDYGSATGGTGGTASSSGGGEGGGEGGAGGGAAGGPCKLFPDDCPAGQKCSVVDESIGYPGGTACIEADTRGPWTRCTADAQCARGLVCDRLKQACRPLCRDLWDCDVTHGGTGGWCGPVPKTPEIGVIPGLNACTAHCHPFTAQPCSDAHGAMTCVPDATTEDTDCVWTEGRAVGATCSSKNHCERGSLCIDYCAAVCTPPGGGGDPQDDCSTPSNCTAMTPDLLYEETEFGVCFTL